MLEIAVVSIVALFASILTFFSGFGLGTILTPVMAIFFPIEVAISVTAVVHLLNNLFKIILIGKNVNWKLLMQFGLPAIVGAFFGAKLLYALTLENHAVEYELFGNLFTTTIVNIVVAILLLVFVVLEFIPFKREGFDKSWIPIGGVLSGFFGGLSGNQGALRSAFLIRLNLTKELFIATGVAIACVVDLTRIPVYLAGMPEGLLVEQSELLFAASFSAFLGAYLGRKSLTKITLRHIQVIVAVLIAAVSVLLILGII